MVKNYIAIVFDGPPSHEAGRFIEVNDSHGKSIDIGTWVSRGDGSWELRIAVDKLKDDNDMTVDTSREAVRIFIAEMRARAKTDSPEHLTLWQSAYTLAALLNERDELRQALFECYQVSGADTDGADAREMAESWQLYPRCVVEAVRELRQKADDDTEYDAQQQRIRALEAEVARKVHVIRHLERERIAEAGRAERAEAERDKAVKERARLETQKDILWAGLNDAKVHIVRVEAERDRLTAKLAAVKAYRDAVRGTQAGRDLELILADTNEGSGINA